MELSHGRWLPRIELYIILRYFSWGYFSGFFPMHDSMICWLLENVIRPFLIPQWNLWIYFFFERAKMFSFPVVQDIPIWWKIFPDKTSDSRRAEGHNSHVMFQNRLKAKRKGGEVFLKAFKQMSHYRKYFCPLKSLWKTLSWFHLCCHLISPTTQKKKNARMW